MNRLSIAERARIVACLVEGNSLRATARITGFARMTIEKLLKDLGAACRQYHDERVRELTCKRVQADEIWSFCYARKANVPADKKGVFGYGDVWTWTAMDADTKLMIAYRVDDRSGEAAVDFMQDTAARIANRVQLTTDGLSSYLRAVDVAFGTDIDFATLHKIYTSNPDSSKLFTPPVCVGCKKVEVTGDPDPKHISTSYVERQNLTMRMHIRRFTRLTNAFSKKIENHEHAIALHFMHYNFCKIHQTLRVTPAMEAGLSSHVWSLAELAALAI